MKHLAASLALLALSAPVLAQAPLYDIHGPAGSGLGGGLGSVGDVDGDGRDDILVGAPTADGSQPQSGQVMILSSVTTLPIRTWNGEHTGDGFGHSVAGIGDINGDGISEVAIGAPFCEANLGTDRGALYIYDGATGALLHKHVGVSDNDRLGWCVIPAGDPNLDGVPDYAYGTPFFDSTTLGVDVGEVRINSGATFNTLEVYHGEVAGDEFGYSISCTGDLDGDGKADLVAGAPFYDVPGIALAGRVYRLSGGMNVRTMWLTGQTIAGLMGYSVSAVPDINLDGKTDILIGEPGYSGGGPAEGRVLAMSGVIGLLLQGWVGSTGDQCGYSVAGLHDIDGDGRGDVIIGSPRHASAPLADNGKVYICSGGSGAVLATASGYNNSDLMGSFVANAGDLNNDGYDDILMSAPTSSGVFPDGGWVRVHLGGAPAATVYCTPKINSQGCTPVIGYSGCASRSLGAGLQVVAQNVRPGIPGLLIWSVNQGASPFFGGTLCLGNPVKRTPAQISTTIPGFPCTGQYVYLFTPSFFALNNLNGGQDVYSQFWSRDNGFSVPNNVGLTAGLKFTVAP